MTTSKGIRFEVDDDRLDLIEMRGWTLHASGYICREVYVPVDDPRPGRRTRRHRIWLHHEVLGTRPDPSRQVRVDHIDGDHMNNRRCNLRLVTPAQNAQNRPPITSRGTYRGVTWHVLHGKWQARAMVNYRSHHIGYFATQEEAAAAVVAWRREHMTHSDQDA